MYFSTIVLCILPLLATAMPSPADTLPKANEYRSGDCSGSINFSHHSASLGDVTMDDSSNSVYLAGAQWVGYSEKTGNGGTCFGDVLTVVANCNNLNNNGLNGGRRINCVRNTS